MASSCWLEGALRREHDRGDNFANIQTLIHEASWFRREWRAVLLRWFSQMGNAYRLSPIVVENAVFFVDVFVADVMLDGRRLSVGDFQVAGLASLLIASKMFGTGSAMTMSGLIALAPQLHLDNNSFIRMELIVLHVLKFNVFIPTAREFVTAFVAEMTTHVTSLADATPALVGLSNSATPTREGDLSRGWVAETLDGVQREAVSLLSLVEAHFALNLEFRQSEKALACTAVALRAFFAAFSAARPVAQVEAAKESFGAAWTALLLSACDHAGLCEDRVEEAVTAVQALQLEQQERRRDPQAFAQAQQRAREQEARHQAIAANLARAAQVERQDNVGVIADTTPRRTAFHSYVGPSDHPAGSTTTTSTANTSSGSSSLTTSAVNGEPRNFSAPVRVAEVLPFEEGSTCRVAHAVSTSAQSSPETAETTAPPTSASTPEAGSLPESQSLAAGALTRVVSLSSSDAPDMEPPADSELDPPSERDVDPRALAQGGLIARSPSMHFVSVGTTSGRKGCFSAGPSSSSSPAAAGATEVGKTGARTSEELCGGGAGASSTTAAAAAANISPVDVADGPATSASPSASFSCMLSKHSLHPSASSGGAHVRTFDEALDGDSMGCPPRRRRRRAASAV